MATQLFANNATGYLNTAIAAGDTSITLQSGQGSLFPSPSAGDWFLATIYDGASTIEIVKCTARSSDTFTVTRAQESTTASAFSAGASVEMAVTKGTLERFVQRLGDTVTVTNGGTGVATLTNHGVVLGQGTSAVAVTSAGTSGQVLTSNGASADPTFQTPSAFGACALLATITPTASANAESLNVFTSSYDAYLIVINGVKPASDDSLVARFAVAGSVDTGSNYYAPGLGTSTTTALINLTGPSTVTSAGKGFTGTLHITNANDTSNIKGAFWQGVYQTGAAPNIADATRSNGYLAANAISGIRFY